MTTRSTFPQARPTASLAARLGATLLSTTFLAFLAITLMLGTNYVAVRVSNRELAPFWGAGLRIAMAALLLLSLARVRGLRLPAGRALAGAVLFGLLVFAALYGLLYRALLFVPAGMASVLMATVPLMTLLLAVLVGQERFHWRAMLGGAAALAGIGLVFWEQLRADVPLGALLLVLLAAASASLSGIVVKRFPRSHPIATNAVAMAVGAAVLLAVSGLLNEPWTLPARSETWAALAWLILSTSGAFVLMVWVLQRWSASATSFSTVLQPLVTVAVAAWLVGEQVTLPFLAGAALALIGVYWGALMSTPENKA
jgi:drug/metabolite transporter (DMT)-like permease